jgi:hypothetical protein
VRSRSSQPDIRFSLVWIAETAIAAGAGILAGCAGFAFTHGYPETRLLAAATVFFLVTIAICVIIGRT